MKDVGREVNGPEAARHRRRPGVRLAETDAGLRRVHERETVGT